MRKANALGFLMIRKPDGEGGQFLEAWRTDDKGKPRELWSSVRVYSTDEDEAAAIREAGGEPYFVSPSRDHKNREGFAFLCAFFGVANPRQEGGRP